MLGSQSGWNREINSSLSCTIRASQGLFFIVDDKLEGVDSNGRDSINFSRWCQKGI